jgi:iron complex transport system substrate-binding protein
MKISKLRFGAFAAVAAIGLGALPATSAAQTVVAHAKGQTELRQVPRKVAVFDLATLDNLTALGVDAVVGVPKGEQGNGSLPPHLARYADPRYRNIGTLFEPDVAALTALGPDLIVVGGRSARRYDAMRAIAPTIDLSPTGTGLSATAIANTRTLGLAFGVADRAEKRIAAFEAQLAALHARAASAGSGLMLFATGRGISAQAPGDRFGTAYEFIGLRPAVPPVIPAARGTRAAAGSPEADAAAAKREAALAAALATDPDWLIVLDRAAATGTTPSPIARRLAADPRIAASTAWKAGRVIYLDPKSWYLVGAGIDALSESAAETLAVLNGS